MRALWSRLAMTKARMPAVMVTPKLQPVLSALMRLVHAADEHPEHDGAAGELAGVLALVNVAEPYSFAVFGRRGGGCG